MLLALLFTQSFCWLFLFTSYTKHLDLHYKLFFVLNGWGCFDSWWGLLSLFEKVMLLIFSHTCCQDILHSWKCRFCSLWFPWVIGALPWGEPFKGASPPYIVMGCNDLFVHLLCTQPCNSTWLLSSLRSGFHTESHCFLFYFIVILVEILILSCDHCDTCS